MNKNICIILLIFLIVYLIYKISSNCFSVGFSVGGGDETKCNLNNGNCNLECIDEDNKICGVNMNTSNTKNMHSCNDIEESDLVNFAECNDGYSLDVHWYSGDDGDYCIFSCVPSPPPKIKLEPKDKNPSQFLADINKAYDTNSSSVFVSMIIPDMIGMDGSGSVLNKNTYTGIFGQFCSIGFIWDTDWLDKNLIDCLFAIDIGSEFFDSSDCNSPNYCEFANTSSSNTPDRCSHGLKNYYEYINNFLNPEYHKMKKGLPYPINCKKNIIYNLEKFSRDPLEDKNCFTYINDKYENVKKIEEYLDDYVMNEGIFIKDVGEEALDYHIGIKRLKELNKPLPSALLFIYNKVCAKDTNYIKTLKGLKSNFTKDTMVVKAQYDSAKKSIISFDTTPTILGDMPGYDEV